MRTWWRERPLNKVEEYLLEALCQAHHESCFRSNVSTANVVNCASGSNDMAKSIAAAILTIGGRHAPIEQTYDFLNLDRPVEAVGPMVSDGRFVPGWGNSFIKDGPDEMWKMVDAALRDYFTELSKDMDAVTERLHELGKKLYPNPSAYTAAVAIALSVPKKAAVCLFISARLDAWSSIAYNQLEK